MMEHSIFQKIVVGMMSEFLRTMAKVAGISIIGLAFLYAAEKMGYQAFYTQGINEISVLEMFVVVFIAVLLGKD